MNKKHDYKRNHGILMIVFEIVIIDSSEGFVEFKKYKVVNSHKVCRDKLYSDFLEDSKPFNKSSTIGQFRLGVALDLIQCKEGHGLVIRTEFSSRLYKNRKC